MCLTSITLSLPRRRATSSGRLSATTGLRLHRHAVLVDHFAAEPTRDRYQDDAEHGEQDGDDVAPAYQSRAARRAEVETCREDEQRDDVQARVPVGELLHLSVSYRKPIDDARHGGGRRPDDAAQERVERDPVPPNEVASPKIDHVRDERKDPEGYRERDEHRVDGMPAETRRTCHNYLLSMPHRSSQQPSSDVSRSNS